MAVLAGAILSMLSMSVALIFATWCNEVLGPMSEQAFLGEVATWTGIVTGTLMFASPALFARWKWRGVAGATPAFMLWTGLPFFVGCVAYNLTHPGAAIGTAAL